MTPSVSPVKVEEEEPLSSRSSYYSAIEQADTSNVDETSPYEKVELITTSNGDVRLNDKTASNLGIKTASTHSHSVSTFTISIPTPSKSNRSFSSSSPSVRRLPYHQKQAVNSFIDAPSASNWEELVGSMKKSLQEKNNRASSNLDENHNDDGGSTNVLVPRPPVKDMRQISFEPEQVHSVKDLNIMPRINGATNNGNNNTSNNQLHGLAEDFAVEHGIFLKAVLQLLHEKEQPTHNLEVEQQQISEANFENIQDIIKIGSLKKASKRVKGVWNVKFVEIRRGVFSYYGDQAVTSQRQRKRRTSAPSLNFNITDSTEESTHDGPALPRKDIPLHASECICRAVKFRRRPGTGHRRNATHGAAFELVRDGRRHLLMANSDEERRHWIQAIHSAMIGASVTRGENFLEYQVDDEDEGRGKTNINKRIGVPENTPHSDSMEQYLNVRDVINSSHSKEDYMSALSGLSDREHMIVPVQWVKNQFDRHSSGAFTENEVSSSVEQLWKDLCRDSVEINGQILMGDAHRGPDRILGKLTRQILSLANSNVSPTLKSDQITEAQAVSYARDILLASDRTRSGGDSYYCAEHLFLNRELVALCPSSVQAEPLSIKVIPALGKGSNVNDMHDVVCGWASVRIPNKPWARSFLILGRTVLHCYAKAEPRPHQLREKLYLKNAVIDDSSSFGEVKGEQTETLQFSVIMNNGRSLRRDFRFDDEFNYLFWRKAFECSAESATMCSFRESIDINGMEFSDDYRASSLLDESKDSSYNSPAPRLLSRNNPPAVDVDIKVSAEYKVVTIDPEGDESHDTWVTLRTSFMQKFHLSGGSSGRISRGDEVVMLELL